jgi:hypothetical protein
MNTLDPQGAVALTKAQREDLIKEENLWQVWRGSLRIPFSRFNKVVLILSAILLTVDALVSEDAGAMLGFVRGMSKDGVSIGLSVLSLLLSGFAVFATISQPTMLLSMAANVHESGLSYLKYNFFLFMRVFCLLVGFTAVSLVLMIAGRDDGLGFQLVQLAGGSVWFRDSMIRVAYVMLGIGYVLVVLQLKSFVFNIYYSVMTSLRWRSEGGA